MEQTQNAFADLTVEQVLELVNAGEYTPEEAVEIEKQGKNRSTLIAELEKLSQPPNGDPGDGGDGSAPASEPEKQKPKKARKEKVKLLKNIKYNRQRYKIGQEIEIDPSEREAFVKAEIIEGD